MNKLIDKMTLEEKASMCSGQDFWNTKAIPRLGISSIMLTDGPHGLRKQEAKADHLGINESVKSTCFPPACTTGNSFDTQLIERIGVAIAEECVQENVSVLLGPGLNIKRSPLCGRNFEYFSEDPLLSGAMAAAFVCGVQSKGVGACLKHFAANSQEKARMVNDSIVDERALREIYLRGFEFAVKKSNPYMIMGSYNKVNSVYACESHRLLTEILRDEWGFSGVAVTDWGAINDRVKDLDAGLDLEMPSSNGDNDKLIVKAVKSGKLSLDILNESVDRILTLIGKTKNAPIKCDMDSHHELARAAALSSAVLLKNQDSNLPLNKTDEVCIIGQFAKELRYQGGGSSHINPSRVDNVLDVMKEEGIQYNYCEGYDVNSDAPDIVKLEYAVSIAKSSKSVVIFAGLPDSYESEGFDRAYLDMPTSHNDLIEAVAKVNSNVTVVLISGSVVNMPWADKVKSILLMSLSGQAGGSAAVGLLFGEVSPSGRLAETFISDIKTTPSYLNYGNARITPYKESVFVGYRYFNSANVPVTFPFGYGLSYCNFEYSSFKLSKFILRHGEKLSITVDVTNSSAVGGSEVVQIYVKPPNVGNFRPERELKAFTKVFIDAGATTTVTLELTIDDFGYYNVETHGFEVESGKHEIILGKSATEAIDVRIVDLDVEAVQVPSSYKNYLPQGQPLNVSDTQFSALIGRDIPKYIAPREGTYSALSTLGEIKDTKLGANLYSQTLSGMQQQIGNAFGDDLSNLEEMLKDMPLKALALFSGGQITSEMLDGFVYIMNGKKLRGMIKLIKGNPKK